MIDLSAAAFTTSPILNEATSCGSTTDRLKIPIYRPILLWSTRSLMIANGRDTREAQPIPNGNDRYVQRQIGNMEQLWHGPLALCRPYPLGERNL